MSEHDDKHFSAEHVFKWLFIWTILEVAYGYFGDWIGMGRVPLWGGLIACAICKAWLIAAWFMHLRFEGWIVKGLLLPTPFLIVYLLTILTPDVASNDLMKHDVGAELDPYSGRVQKTMGAQDSVLYDADH